MMSLPEGFVRYSFPPQNSLGEPATKQCRKHVPKNKQQPFLSEFLSQSSKSTEITRLSMKGMIVSAENDCFFVFSPFVCTEEALIFLNVFSSICE